MSEWDRMRAENQKLREALRMCKDALKHAETESDEYGCAGCHAFPPWYSDSEGHKPDCVVHLALRAAEEAMK